MASFGRLVESGRFARGEQWGLGIISPSVSFFKPRLLVLVLVGALSVAASMGGCSGTAFQTADATAGGPAAAGATASGGGSSAGSGPGMSCSGPEDCPDEGDPCTVELCNADGTCKSEPKCKSTEQCCGGDCAQCCDDADCDDGVECTSNVCFSSQCLFVPMDSNCDSGQYCSTKDGCRQKQVCGVLGNESKVVCDDTNGCTVDSCVDNFCQHDFCPDPNAKLCCEGGNCAACCNDLQCDTDSDPCTVGSCQNGTCHLVPLCTGGADCCPSADGKSATCGACCSAADCDDKIGCTEDKCGAGQCTHTPGSCDGGYVCNATKGCVKPPDCTSADQCRPGACQTNPRCEGGSCKFDGCATGTRCCANTGSTSGTCAACCSDAGCNDNVACTTDKCTASGCTHTPDGVCPKGQTCDRELGCIACKQDSDCNDGLACTNDSCVQQKCVAVSTCPADHFCTAQGCVSCITDSDCQSPITTFALPVGGSCSRTGCHNGQCLTTSETCSNGNVCCAPYGCQPQCVQLQ